MSLVWAKRRRFARKYGRCYLSVVSGPITDSKQLLTFAASVLGTMFLIRRGSASDVAEEVRDWEIAVEAFLWVMVAWGIVSLFLAAIRTRNEEKASGAFRGNTFSYSKPLHVFTREFFANGLTNMEKVRFPDAEPHSFVRYSIEFEPPVGNRVSSMLSTGEMPLGDPAQGGPRGRGGVRIGGNREAHLLVRLQDQTVPVICRVYCHSFAIGADEFMEVDKAK